MGSLEGACLPLWSGVVTDEVVQYYINNSFLFIMDSIVIALIFKSKYVTDICGP